MTDMVHVLVYGSLDYGVTDSLRVGCFVEPLAALGVEVRSWQSFAGDLLSGGAPAAWEPASPSGDVLLDAGLPALAWADVVVFRRWRSTHLVCTDCERAFGTEPELAAHVRASGHRTLVPDRLLRPIVELISAHPELLGDRGVVYDADDDVLDYPDWTGLGQAARRERDLILRILAVADLVTAATPVLAERLQPHTRSRVRVIRNAVDPAWYAGAPTRDPSDAPRVLYHGAPVRLRDYQLARPAVDAVAAERPGLRRVWLGAAHEPRVVAAMDEVGPWVDGLAAFGAALAGARPDIGLAPLLDEPFNRAKSELHWIEYAMAGAPAIVSGFAGGGPFDVVRDGIDGMVAGSPADWARHLRGLVASPALRAEIAGRAHERALADYSISVRAGEWLDAYRWTADHAGISRRAAAFASVPARAVPDLK